MFCTIDDMICRFGAEEMICLADKSQPRTGTLDSSILSIDDPLATANEKRVLKAIEDACGEMLLELSVCYDTVKIKQVYEPVADPATGIIPPASSIIGFEHLCADIARYHLYDTIYLASEHNGKDHESFRRYTDAIEHLKTICQGGKLMTQDCDILERRLKHAISVTNNHSCLPKNKCCHCQRTGCDCGEYNW